MQVNPLDQLNDVVIPQSVSWWPLSYPMWGAIFVAVAIIVSACWLYYRRQQFLKAKKEAIKLSQVQENPQALHALLKRLVKHYYGDVAASRYGKEWLALQAKLTRVELTQQELDSLYAPTQAPELSNKLVRAISTFKVKERLDV
ncbi:DUF4381 domain-containing protein [Pseudoalteromonas piscicida]|uniref:DUF4381 domain-containing protein n=1 Tax=Pseudoalteromonas piscicida TaxID=43662 RepID=UPI00309E655A